MSELEKLYAEKELLTRRLYSINNKEFSSVKRQIKNLIEIIEQEIKNKKNDKVLS